MCLHVKFAKRPRVHTFLATSEIHMKHKLRMTKDQASYWSWGTESWGTKLHMVHGHVGLLASST